MHIPRIALLATGGTIAGTGSHENYTAATLELDQLLTAVPGLRELADWQAEQVFALDSRDMHPEHWLQLAERTRKQIEDPTIDAVLITHGTDTLEETAFALHLLLNTQKPVVLTAAMRPADSLSADGPLNLLQAARVALHPDARGRGVMVVANDLIIAGQDVGKAHTHNTAALCADSGRAELGAIIGKRIVWRSPPAPVLPTPWLIPAGQPVPRVDILYAYAGASSDLLRACCENGAQGIVLALSGQGSIPESWRHEIAEAITQGVRIVRASRIPAGGVLPGCNENDEQTGCIPAGFHSPQKARALLLLALMAKPQSTRQEICKLFGLS